jgi:hypothetical protein
MIRSVSPFTSAQVEAAQGRGPARCSLPALRLGCRLLRRRSKRRHQAHGGKAIECTIPHAREYLHSVVSSKVSAIVPARSDYGNPGPAD